MHKGDLQSSVALADCQMLRSKSTPQDVPMDPRYKNERLWYTVPVTYCRNRAKVGSRLGQRMSLLCSDELGKPQDESQVYAVINPIANSEKLQW